MQIGDVVYCNNNVQGECGWFVFAAKVVKLGSIVWFEIKQSMMRKGNLLVMLIEGVRRHDKLDWLSNGAVGSRPREYWRNETAKKQRV
ncbi:hypothetical protein C5167_034258 [Papaver somniferum]|uniref:Uncharacterized protein n=1 Tax=Papaver somniferum TaxID=3469 RepID=A0A4Y7KGR4_PAPSO|nr:hypothetical protein C5167_034258 [Papaver somniferum]